VQRDGKRVQLTRNGHDWTHRLPRIAGAALRNRNSSFVIDGEAVLLGVDGLSDFNGLHSRKHDDEVQLYAFNHVSDGDGSASCRWAYARPTWPGCWRGGRTASSSSATSNRVRSGRICSDTPA